MGNRFAELTFTPAVKAQQEMHGSRRQYQRMQQGDESGGLLGPYEKDFIQERDGFYMASISETGWPYIQFRGGDPGFLQVLDEKTLGFADLRGNKQYISVGNLLSRDKVCLFLMNYPEQQRLKLLGRAEIVEGDARAGELIASLRTKGKTYPERAILIHVEAFDWNCPQHITPRYSVRELEAMGQREQIISGDQTEHA
jgi:predicted pyridoxine 5'-phosphate oxidase superfamily flavin-nucleotide-binding protein